MPEDKFLKQAAPGLNAEDLSDTFIRRDTRDSPAQRTTVENRGRPRHAVSLSAEVVEPRSRARLACRATDFSMGGRYVDMTNPFAAGTDVHLRLVSEGRVFQTEARVLYATQGMGMGLAFTKMAPEHLEILRDWMQELVGETARPEIALGAGFDFEEQTKFEEAGNLRAIVTELVRLLARKQILTDSEAAEFQKKLLRGPG